MPNNICHVVAFSHSNLVIHFTIKYINTTCLTLSINLHYEIDFVKIILKRFTTYIETRFDEELTAKH